MPSADFYWRLKIVAWLRRTLIFQSQHYFYTFFPNASFHSLECSESVSQMESTVKASILDLKYLFFSQKVLLFSRQIGICLLFGVRYSKREQYNFR